MTNGKQIAMLKQQNEEYSQTIEALKIENAEQRQMIEGLRIGHNYSQSAHDQIAKQIHGISIDHYVEMQNETYALRHELGQIKALISDECKHPFIESTKSQIRFVHISDGGTDPSSNSNAYHFQVISDFFMNDNFEADDFDALKLKIDAMEKQNKESMELLLNGGVSSETSIPSMSASEDTVDDDEHAYDDNYHDDIFDEDDYDEMEELFKKCDFENGRTSLRIYQNYVSKSSCDGGYGGYDHGRNQFVWLAFTRNRY